MSLAISELVAAIKAKTARIGMMDLGHMGFPLASSFTSVGFLVLAYDPTPNRTDASTTQLDGALSNNRLEEFTVTNDPERLFEADVLIIHIEVPLISARSPDLTILTQVMQTIGKRLRVGQLVLLIGTVPPGTIRTIVLPLLSESRLVVGRDFLLAFSSEAQNGCGKAAPRAMGGFDALSLEAASELFRFTSPFVKEMSSLEAVEVCGMVWAINQTVRRAVTNELKIICDRMSVDVQEVLSAYKPSELSGFEMSLESRDLIPDLFAWGVRRYGASARLIELACEVNDAMPAFVLEKVAQALNKEGKALKGSHILMIGMSDDNNLYDPRNSPAFELMQLLLKRRAVVRYYDPYLPELPQMQDWPDLRIKSTPVTSNLLASQACVVFVTNHTTYDSKFIVAQSSLVVDTCNATKDVISGREKIIQV